MINEGGIRGQQFHFVRMYRGGDGWEFPTATPFWTQFSNTVRSFEFDPDPGYEEQRGAGDVDVNNHFRGPEEHTFSVVYDLQSWPITAQGDVSGPLADGIRRGDANEAVAAHTLINREETRVSGGNSVSASVGLGGGPNRPSRIYTVGMGALVDEATITGDPGDQQPVAVELTYEAEYGRIHQIDQPTDTEGAVQLAVVSTSPTDTGQVIVESDAGTQETVTLNGETPVSTVASFSDISAVWIPTPQDGDVRVHINNGDVLAPVLGDLLAQINGAGAYGGVEGDFGVPPVQGGQKQTGNLGQYETFLGDGISRADGGPVGQDINSISITVSNNVERTNRHTTRRQRLRFGTRDVELSANVIGEAQSARNSVQALTNYAVNITWNLSNGSLTVENATLTEPGGRTVEAEQATMELDVTFSGEGIILSNANA